MMKTADKEKIINLWRSMREQQWGGDYYGPEGSACAMGHVYISEGVLYDDGSTDWAIRTSLVDAKYGFNEILSDQTYAELCEIDELAGCISLSNAVIFMNDNLGWTLDDIADWFEENVIPEDVPGTIPVEWTKEAPHVEEGLSLSGARH
jgi:hypothetical protein